MDYNVFIIEEHNFMFYIIQERTTASRGCWRKHTFMNNIFLISVKGVIEDNLIDIKLYTFKYVNI